LQGYFAIIAISQEEAMETQTLLEELNNVGKLEKFDVLLKLIENTFEQRSQSLFIYAEKMLGLMQDYLEFDPIPPQTICDKMSQCFLYMFKFIQNTNNLELFKKYHPIYEQYRAFLTEPISTAKLFQSFGYLFWLQQNFRQGIYYLKQSLELINQHGHVNDIPNRYTNIGYMYENSGQYNEAEKYYQLGLDFAKKNNSLAALKMAYSAFGRLHFCRKNYEKALHYYQEALALFEKDEESMERATILCNLASSYQFLNKPEQALFYYNQLQSEWIKNENPDLYYSTLLNMAVLHIHQNQVQQAEPLLQQAIHCGERSGSQELLGSCYINYSIAYSQKGDYVSALEYARLAAELGKTIGNKRLIHSAYQHMADAYQKSGQHKKAIPYLQKCEVYYQREKSQRNVIAIYKALSNSFEQISEYQQALDYYKKFFAEKEAFEQQKHEKEKELKAHPLQGKEAPKQYLFYNGISLISNELKEKIGVPIIGQSTKMRNLIKKALLIAGSSDSNVLIQGKSGTGKELIARLIHFSSPRKDKPFIAVNSAAFSSGITESAFFGHVKGAFTGAHRSQIGYFEAADGGTLFLDEIGDMPPSMQAMFLRVLEEKKISPVGSPRFRKVDFRLICATNCDIEKLIEEDSFRFDLFSRIRTLEIKTPSLQERKEDIPLLINFYLRTISNKLEIKTPTIEPQAMKQLCTYNYPGNVRELYTVIERLILFCKNGIIKADDVFFENEAEPISSSGENFPLMKLHEMEMKLIEEAMKRAGNVQAVAAKMLGISPYALNRRLKKIKEEQ